MVHTPDHDEPQPYSPEYVEGSRKFGNLLRVHQHARVHGHLPLLANLGVHLAHPALPAHLPALRVTPQGVYVHYRERPSPCSETSTFFVSLTFRRSPWCRRVPASR